MINFFDCSRDEVIKSAFLPGVTSYRFALSNLVPLLDRFGEQRKAQNKKFYDRLRRDILTGCVMPPVTLAFVNSDLAGSVRLSELSDFINSQILEGYILDGMQRIITLADVSVNRDFDGRRPLYLNVIVAERYDLLLYRMITLNNGQKPMTARHQIEMLTKGAINISGVEFPITTEKQTEGTKISNAFRMSDIAEAYTAYLSDSLHNQNSRIIESKLDEILVGRVMESDITNQRYSFSEILREVGRLQTTNRVRDWLRQLNNLIGFTVGAKSSLDFIRQIGPDQMERCIETFEVAFDAINQSKVNVGKFRRELSCYYVRQISELKDVSQEVLTELFFEQTLTD